MIYKSGNAGHVFNILVENFLTKPLHIIFDPFFLFDENHFQSFLLHLQSLGIVIEINNRLDFKHAIWFKC